MLINKAAAAKGESGFTLIDLLFTASLICTLATMSLPSLMRARGVAQSASALGTVRVVNSSQLSFAVTCGSGFYAPDFLTLGIAPANVSIKGKSNEGMGWIGRGEGVAALAVAAIDALR